MDAGFKKLKGYQLAYQLAMEIFELSKSFPKEETYSLTDQIRRSSRSVCTNIAEAYRKRRYPKHFLSKLSDADTENSETLVWLDFALSCNYINKQEYEQIVIKQTETGKLIGYMMKHPKKFSPADHRTK